MTRNLLDAMRIHREGFRLLATVGVVIGLFWRALSTQPPFVRWLARGGTGVLYLWLLLFFRVPKWRGNYDIASGITSPASGTIVAINPVFESEYFQSNRLQVSIFLSVFNVHVTAAPITGTILHRAYHPGRYLIAFHPKASMLNEHATLVIEAVDGERLLVRQIAGILARRISTYPIVGDVVHRGANIGFIKFGSRVDVILPLDVALQVQVGDRMRVGVTPLAVFGARSV